MKFLTVRTCTRVFDKCGVMLCGVMWCDKQPLKEE